MCLTSRQSKNHSENLPDPFVTGDAWRYYLSLERSLADFIDNVPLDRQNDHVFSPRLGAIIISASTQIEATFKAIIACKALDIDENIDKLKLERARNAIERNASNLNHYREVLEPHLLLSKRVVSIKQPPRVFREVKPFWTFAAGKQPHWWKTYTDLKHSFYSNVKEATLKSTLLSVAALFLVQLMHIEHRRLLLDLEVIRGVDREYGIGPNKQTVATALCSSPREIQSYSVFNLWAETEFFEFDFMKLGKQGKVKN